MTVVIDSLAAPSHLLQRSMRDRLRDKVGEIVFEANTETPLCMRAVKIVQDCFPDPGAKMFDLVVEVIDNVLLQTRQMYNQDWANNCENKSGAM